MNMNAFTYMILIQYGYHHRCELRITFVNIMCHKVFDDIQSIDNDRDTDIII